MNDINHEHTDEITCPWCGEVHGDSWERRDEGEDECSNCGKRFKYSRNVFVDYSTEAVEDEE